MTTVSGKKKKSYLFGQIHVWFHHEGLWEVSNYTEFSSCIVCWRTYSKNKYLPQKKQPMVWVLKFKIQMESYPIDIIFLDSCALRFVSQKCCVLLGITARMITTGCISQATSYLVAFWLWSMADIGREVDSEWKGKSRICASISCLSKVVSSTTTVLLPNLHMPPERPSLVPVSTGWLWSLNSGTITSSICHIGLGVIMVFCFLISESLYRFRVLCLVFFTTCITSSLH